MLMMIFGVSRCVTLTDATKPPAERPRPPPSRACVAAWGLAIATGIFLPRLWLLGSDDPNYVYFATALPLTAWSLAYFVLMPRVSCDLAALAVGAGFAVVAFLLQDMVNFASHVPGALTTAVAVIAVLIAARYASGQLCERHSLPKPLLWTVATAVLLASVVGVVIVPVARSVAAMTQARRMGETPAAVERFDAAAAADPLDARPLYEGARLLRYMTTERGGGVRSISGAIARIEQAITRDPDHLLFRRERSRCYLARAAITHDAKDYATAVDAARSAIDLYPISPEVHEQLGDCLAAFGRATNNGALLVQAVDAYHQALAIDDARPQWERLRRLSPQRRASLNRRIAELEAPLRRRTDAK